MPLQPLQAARKIHIAKFRAAKVSTLIVTDVAARGIDIPLLDNVINYGERKCGRDSMLRIQSY